MFGDKLINLRKSQNITQEELAELLNVSRQSVSKWESNIAYPETEKIIKISELFSVTIDSLLKDVEVLQEAVTDEAAKNMIPDNDREQDSAFKNAAKTESKNSKATCLSVSLKICITTFLTATALLIAALVVNSFRVELLISCSVFFIVAFVCLIYHRKHRLIANATAESKKISLPLFICIRLTAIAAVLAAMTLLRLFGSNILIVSAIFFVVALFCLLIHYRHRLCRINALFYWALSIIGTILFSVGLICMSDKFTTLDTSFLNLMTIFGAMTVIGLVLLFFKGRKE